MTQSTCEQSDIDMNDCSELVQVSRRGQHARGFHQSISLVHVGPYEQLNHSDWNSLKMRIKMLSFNTIIKIGALELIMIEIALLRLN